MKDGMTTTLRILSARAFTLFIASTDRKRGRYIDQMYSVSHVKTQSVVRCHPSNIMNIVLDIIK